MRVKHITVKKLTNLWPSIKLLHNIFNEASQITN